MNYSLLRYPGGKTRAVAHLEKYIPKGTMEICSPFFGGGSFEIYLASIGIKVFGYDNFLPLVSFWRSLLNWNDELRKVVEAHYPMSKESFYALQKSILLMDNEINRGGGILRTKQIKFFRYRTKRRHVPESSTFHTKTD